MLVRWLLAQFLSIPAKECESGTSFDAFLAKKFVSVGFEEETESGDDPTLLQKFAYWVMDKTDIDCENEYLKKLLVMARAKASHYAGIYECVRAPPSSSVGPMGARLYPTLRQFILAMKPLQAQMPRIKNSLSKIEVSVDEGVKVLGEIRDTAARVESILAETLKTAEAAQAKGPTKENESVVLGLVEKLKKVEDHEFTVLLQKLDKLSEIAEIPVNIKTRVQAVIKEVVSARAWITGFTSAWAVRLIPDKQKPDIEVPEKNPETQNPVPEEPKNTETQKPDSEAHAGMTPVQPIPFYRLGKVARDVLYKHYLGDDVPYHCDIRCLFKTERNLSFSLKATSAPKVCAVLKHDLFGSQLKGEVKVLLPFKNRFDERGAEVPVEETSMAKLIYLQERVCLSATVGLHANPAVNLEAMLGAPVIYGCSFSGGGRLKFNSTDGAVVGLDAGFLLSNSGWGTFSATARLLEKNRGLNVLYNHKLLEKSTIAAELDYDHLKQSVVVSAGVEHQHDSYMLFKAMVKSDGHAQAMVESREGIAGLKVRASVKVDLRKLHQAPKVGFSVSLNPTNRRGSNGGQQQ